MAEAIAANTATSSQMVQYIMKRIKNSDPLHLLINGAKGSGKTHLVDSLKEQLKKSRIPYLLLTHTNTRARLIGGETIYKKFKINPHKLSTPSTVNKKGYRKFKVLILDQVCQLQVEALVAVDDAIRKIKELPELFFGNIHLVFIGDFCQLPCSKGEPSYLSSDQEKDNEFRQRLGRWATGAVLLDDIEFLREKSICHADGDLFLKTAKFFLDSEWDKKHSLILTPNHTEVLKFSEHLLRLRNITVFEKMEPMLIKTLKKGEMKPSFTPAPVSNPMYIGIGALVTFTRKTASCEGPHGEKGDVGRIVDIFKKDGRVVTITMKIGFNFYFSTFCRQQTLISKTDEVVTWSYDFYLRPAHVSTIHDAQGRILEHAIIHTHNEAFDPAVFYSAASRIESSEGLHFTHIGEPSLDDLKEMIHANPHVLSQFSRMEARFPTNFTQM